jgi:hypothetical protein
MFEPFPCKLRGLVEEVFEAEGRADEAFARQAELMLARIDSRRTIRATEAAAPIEDSSAVGEIYAERALRRRKRSFRQAGKPGRAGQ